MRLALKARAHIQRAQQAYPDAHRLCRAQHLVRKFVWVGVGLAIAVVVQVVELAHHRNPAGQHLQKRGPGHVVHIVRRYKSRRTIHLLAPGPESVAARRTPFGPPAKQPLKAMRVRIGQPRQQRLATQPHGLHFGLAQARIHFSRRNHAHHTPIAVHQQCGGLPRASFRVQQFRQVKSWHQESRVLRSLLLPPGRTKPDSNTNPRLRRGFPFHLRFRAVIFTIRLPRPALPLRQSRPAPHRRPKQPD